MEERTHRCPFGDRPRSNAENAQVKPSELEYVGLWPRVGASLVDGILLAVLICPILTAIYGKEYWSGSVFLSGPLDFVLSYFLPALLTILFWMAKKATPGKMLIGATIVDSDTGGAPTTGKYVARYLGYFVALIPLGIGIITLAWDPRRQGWHDKLARTVVIRKRMRAPDEVRFDGASQR